MRWLLTCLLATCIGAAGCTAINEEKGGGCEKTYQCETGLICFDGTCRSRFGVGKKCDPSLTSYQRQCKDELRCGAEGVCITADEMKERLAAARREREKEMLRASGVSDERAQQEPEIPERVTPEPAAGLRVRVSRAKGQGSAFAACRTDERLVGGGCSSTSAARRSYPSHNSESDTVGARWNCELDGMPGSDVSAYALCQSTIAAAKPR